jgi:hypothetical protein
MYPPNINNNIPGHIEAALQYLRFSEEIRFPNAYGGTPKSGRRLSKTEFEVMDSAHIVLLQYFNQAVPMADFIHANQPSSASENADG